MALQITTPVGRLVSGSPFVPNTTDYEGNPLVGADKVTPRVEYFIGVAFAKNDPAWVSFKAQLLAEARSAWPQFHDAAGNCTHPGMAFKIRDGDGRNSKGALNSDKEGWAGHEIVGFSSGFAPAVYHVGHYAPAEQVIDPNALKLGYFVRVAMTYVTNKNDKNPGMYTNYGMVEITRQGDVIISGPSAADAFGSSAPVLPAAALAPPAPLPPLVTPAVPVVPHTAYMQPPVAVAPPPAPPAPPPAPPAPPPGPQMTATATATYEMYRSSGWTDEQLRAAGYMI